MKKNVVPPILLFVALALPLFAESVDRFWIIRENTGSSETMVKLDTPRLSAQQTVELFIEVEGLSARWGEGFVYYTYTCYSIAGKKIWTSREFSKRKRTSDETWTFEYVQRVTIPRNLPDGRYRLEIELTDYHTRTDYRGNARFSIGEESPSLPSGDDSRSAGGDASGSAPDSSTPGSGVIDPDSSDSGSAPESGAPDSGTDDYKAAVGRIELELLSVDKDEDRLILTLRGVNRDASEERLKLYTYRTRIVSGQGEEFVFSEYGGGGNLSTGVLFPPEEPVEASFYFEGPVPSRVSLIAHIEIPFYFKEDKVVWHDIPVPWGEREPSD